MANFKELEGATGLATYFCDSHSPWQRGANENGMPRGTFLSFLSFWDSKGDSKGDVLEFLEFLLGRREGTLNYSEFQQ
jgi:hypothetical protein